ncbi:MAG: homoserine O-succinyltransferase [Muribaculaceae bacterium]|nr:homoserine O-succinyltransferase [Muribaculaceae bacterium]
MAIYVAPRLPAIDILGSEGIGSVVPASEAKDSALRIGILNLMPLKVDTETDMLRVMSDAVPDVTVDFIETATHRSSHTPARHLDMFYRKFPEIADRYYDGFIITGAPVEKLDFTHVDYWPELSRIMDWTRSHVTGSVLYVCWGALAGLFHHYGVPKRVLDRKISGVFPHRAVIGDCRLFDGLGDEFYVPHSRFGAVDSDDICANDALTLLASGDGCGVYAVMARAGREIFLTGHAEYAPLTLDSEYRRDMNRGLEPSIPVNYYPGDDPSQKPDAIWVSDARRIMANWIEYYVAR